MRKYYLIAIGIIIAVVAVELGLRAYGLGNPPLYVESEAYEYIYAPNQDIRRFGNRILVNEYSMRSRPLSDGKQDSIRVLFVGDSVINGGAPTDHEELATTILEKALSDSLGVPVRTLNVSAGSWGPDNAAAYLEQHGHFGASLLVMVWSSHDLTDTMDDYKKVGVQVDMPDRRPVSAIGELISRYAWPRVRKVLAYSGRINPGFEGLMSYAINNEMDVIFVLHAERGEIDEAQYTSRGAVVDSLMQSWNIRTLRGVELFDHSHYRDFIHLNAKGQSRLASVLTMPILSLLRDSSDGSQ